MYFIDTHAHLDMIKKLTPAESVQKSGEEGVKYIINVGSSLDGSRKSIEYAGEFPNVFASVGIHPHYVESFSDKEKRILKSLIKGNTGEPEDEEPPGNTRGNRFEKVVAVGETGFDFYRNLSPRLSQEKAFRTHIELALDYDLPLIIHDRDAHKQVLQVVKEYLDHKNFRGVVHCFSGDVNFAMQCMDLGLYISYTGVITFPNARDLIKVVKKVPMDRIFIETDAPYLAPQAKRGKENYPGYVKYIARRIAEIKNLSIEEVAETTSKNAEDFFGINSNNNLKI